MAKVIFDGAGEMPELNRITAKKNYASSSQAHKMGATAMFNDILHYLGKEKYPKLINEVEGQVAVRQHPVYAFQKIPIEGSEGQYNRKFIGLFTVGPDKGDKNYFGFTNSRIKNRAIRLEGTDHLKGVGFNYPWTVNGVDKIKYNHAEESLCIITGSDKTKWTKIWEQSVCGDKETEAEIEVYLKEIYKPAYEVAYYNNPLIVGVDMTLNEINNNIEAFGKRRRVKDDRQYSYCEFWIDGEYDIYYLDAQTNKYEKNGINLLSDLGITADEIVGMTIEEKNDLFISRRVARFKEEAKYYFCIDDAVYQLMFLFIIVASDNFEKNMYPYIMELLWRFFQDDLDSIFSTDNQAQNTKKYSAELHDFTDDTKSAYVFKGEDSAFWQLIELAYGDECKQMGRDIFQAMYDLAPRGTTTMEKLMAFFDEYFFNRAQKYFTPSAYNNDTEYSYEEAWNNKEYVASVDIHPLAQALGSQESTERAFLEKRLIYLMSKFSFGGFSSATDTDLGIISVRTQDPQSFTLTPAIDMYPTVLGGQAQSAVATERVMAGQSVTLPAVGGGNTNVYIVGADWLSDIGDLKDLKVDPSSVVTLTISSKRLRRIKVGDENADSVTSYLGSLSIQKCDSLETIDARNLQTLVGTVDLSNCPRLVEALFGGSNANAIIIAPGSKVEKLQFSDSITTIDLRNNTFLKDVEITSFAKIRFLRLENVPIINGFDVLRQAYNTDGQQLENIRIIGFTYTGNADDLFMLNNIAEGKDKDGNAHKYGSIDANGDPDENSLPVIEGSLHITESVNRSIYDFVQGAFHALALTADNIVDYFIFADPEVSRIVAENWGDGFGTTLEQIEAVTNIGDKFRDNTLIETFDEFGKFINAQAVPTNAFNGATSLKRIDFSNVISLGHKAFWNCYSLNIDDLSLPKLETFGQNVFNGVKIKKVSNLGKITALPDSTSITQNFGDKSVLEEVVLPDTLITIGSHNFREYTLLQKVVIPNSVTNIRDYAFNNCSILQNIDIDFSNIEYIGVGAFTDCALFDKDVVFKNLVSFGNGTHMTGIFNRTKIKKLIINEGVSNICGHAIYDCKEVTLVDFPSTTTNIGRNCVNKTPKLEAMICRATTPPTIDSSSNCTGSGSNPIYVPDASVEAYKTATNWNAHASRIQSIFYYYGYIDFVDPAVRDICVANFDTDGDDVISIEEAAAVTDIGTLFKGNTSITSFDEFKYFTGITTCPNGAFNGCSNLESIKLPSSLTAIPQNFMAGTAISEIIVPGNCVSVSGYFTFANCPNLKRVIFEEGVKNTGSDTRVFNGSPVEYLQVPGTFTQINSFTNMSYLKEVHFTGNSILKNMYFRSHELIKFTVSKDSIYKSVDGVLYSSDGTTLVRVPSGLTTYHIKEGTTIIGDYAFYYNYIEDINIPSTVTDIHSGVFNNCSIKKLVIPANVLNIGGINLLPLFKGSDSLKAVICLREVPPTLSNKSAPFTFDSLVCPIYVPSASLTSYQEANYWSKWADNIKPINVADTLPDIGSVAENDLYKIGEVYWKAEMVDSVLTWVEI